MSGLFNGADDIKGRAAVVVTQEGKGQVVMFATNPIWRWQNLGEFRMIFNTLMNDKNLTPVSVSAPENSHKDANGNHPAL
jgi:hypothetical protein